MLAAMRTVTLAGPWHARSGGTAGRYPALLDSERSVIADADAPANCTLASLITTSQIS